MKLEKSNENISIISNDPQIELRFFIKFSPESPLSLSWQPTAALSSLYICVQLIHVCC